MNSSRNLENTFERGWLDFTGACVSWACAAHCLALPLIVSFLPLVGLSFLLDETVEWTIIGFSIIVAGFSFLPAYFRQHGKLRAIALFFAGIGLILCAHLLFENNFAGEMVFILTGAGLITAAHIVNRRLCRTCTACQITAKNLKSKN